MTIVSISRKKICDAIAKEPATRLARGNWVGVNSEDDKVKSKDCSVCAVGAVMRNALLDREQPAESIDDASIAAMKHEKVRFSQFANGNPDRMVAQSKYMGALSAFFETEYYIREIGWMSGSTRTRALRKLKADCIKFVRKNFPATVQVNINGALPAEDVKVVSQ